MIAPVNLSAAWKFISLFSCIPATWSQSSEGGISWHYLCIDNFHAPMSETLDWARRANFLLCSHHSQHLGRCSWGMSLLRSQTWALHWKEACGSPLHGAVLGHKGKQGTVLSWEGRTAQKFCYCFLLHLHTLKALWVQAQKLMSSSSLLWHEGCYAHELSCCTKQRGFSVILLFLLEIIFKDSITFIWTTRRHITIWNKILGLCSHRFTASDNTLPHLSLGLPITLQPTCTVVVLLSRIQQAFKHTAGILLALKSCSCSTKLYPCALSAAWLLSGQTLIPLPYQQQPPPHTPTLPNFQPPPFKHQLQLLVVQGLGLLNPQISKTWALCQPSAHLPKSGISHVSELLSALKAQN